MSESFAYKTSNIPRLPPHMLVFYKSLKIPVYLCYMYILACKIKKMLGYQAESTFPLMKPPERNAPIMYGSKA
jgi:hypothetical protein